MNKKNTLSRILAIFTLAILAVCLILTLVFAITGSKYFMGMMFVTLVLPVLLWICLFFYKGSKDRSNET